MVVAVGVAAQFSRGWDQSMGFGAWRMPVAPTSWAEFQRLGRELVPLYLKHGAGSTVSVLRQINAEGLPYHIQTLRLKIIFIIRRRVPN